MTGRTVSARIDGLDVARAIAVLGMVGAHVGNDGERADSSDGWAWLAVTHGFPSALFAVLAGVSMTLMLTERGSLAVPDVHARGLARTRVRIAVRAAILVVMGALLVVLGTPVVVILANLGVMFVLALPLLQWRTEMLLVGAFGFVVAGGWLARSAHEVASGVGLAQFPLISTLWAEHYPALAWMAYIMVGLVIGRLALRRASVAWWLMGWGGVVTVLARGVGWGAGDAQVDPWLTTEPHSYSPVEMASNIGVASAVIGLSLLGARWLPRALWPLRAVGSMALTLYVAHLIVIAVVGDAMVWEPSNMAFVVLCAALVAFACAWRAWAGQGPLERLLTVASTRAADRRVP